MRTCSYVVWFFVDENYPEAKRLKMVMDELCKAGEMLCRYEIAKKEAIAREDFDTAKEKKVIVKWGCGVQVWL